MFPERTQKPTDLPWQDDGQACISAELTGWLTGSFGKNTSCHLVTDKNTNLPGKAAGGRKKHNNKI